MQLIVYNKSYSMGQSYYCLYYHLVWTTKYRQPIIHSKWKWQLYERMRLYCAETDYRINFINGIEDHVHLLVSSKPTVALCDMVRDIKRDSFHWVNEQKLCGNEVFTWQDGYAALTVSPSQTPMIKGYIKKQEAHHKKFTYDYELEKFKFVIEQFG